MHTSARCPVGRVLRQRQADDLGAVTLSVVRAQAPLDLGAFVDLEGKSADAVGVAGGRGGVVDAEDELGPRVFVAVDRVCGEARRAVVAGRGFNDGFLGRDLAGPLAPFFRHLRGRHYSNRVGMELGSG
jgi:hypothetical protein